MERPPLSRRPGLFPKREQDREPADDGLSGVRLDYDARFGRKNRGAGPVPFTTQAEKRLARHPVADEALSPSAAFRNRMVFRSIW